MAVHFWKVAQVTKSELWMSMAQQLLGFYNDKNTLESAITSGYNIILEHLPKPDNMDIDII